MELTDAVVPKPEPPEIAGRASSDDQLIATWLHGRSPHTQRAYAADVVRFRSRAGKPLARVTVADIQEFADSLGDQAAASRYRTLSAVKSLLAFGHRIGYLPFDVRRVCACRLSATGSPSAFCRKPTCTAS
jgi:site-specific recombinase XerD